ncbi:hypothetical protein Dda_2714 [Drechslerella dactyloides]|uniref:Uncharacterized protein n=1 Tax=Drechslerella dactyloides TaxID=74499 RepID=A0AAD6J2A9_DREDA|nr:hypothetical protein Dda_2714 [Drechslerella dactyloides]
MIRLQRGGQPAASNGPVEVIDLTNSPSPPPSPHEPRPPVTRRPPTISRRHAPYDARDRDRNRYRERDRERDRRRRRDALQADVIDLDELPDPEPARRTESNREERRHFHHFPPPSPGDIELTFAHARVRQPSRDPFVPPENPYPNPHPPRAGPSGAPAADLPHPDNWFPFLPPLNNARPNFVGIGGALEGLLDLVSGIGIPFPTRFSDFLGMPGNNHRFQLPVPIIPPRDAANEGREFRAPGMNLPWNQVPVFVRENEGEAEVQITGQHHPEDKPIKEARKGFTRSPQSDQAIGCSNCDQELGDSDDEIQKQIWVMKCGHPADVARAAGQETEATEVCGDGVQADGDREDEVHMGNLRLVSLDLLRPT